MKSEVLAKWEYDAEMPPSVIESAEDAGVKIELLQERMSARRIVFRNEADDGSWAIADKPPFLMPDYIGMSGVFDKDLRVAVAEWRTSERFCRVFYWKDENAVLWRVFVAPTGYSLCQALRSVQKEIYFLITPFFVGRSVADWTSSRTKDWLEEQRKQKDSPLSSALRFHLMTDEQKAAYALGFGGNETKCLEQRTRLERLMRNVLWTNAHVGESEKLGWRMAAREDFQMNSGRWALNQSHSPHFNFWSLALRRFGPLQADTSNVMLKQFWRDSQILGEVTAVAPTAHERLEARLELHDWARKNLPSEACAEMERLHP